MVEAKSWYLGDAGSMEEWRRMDGTNGGEMVRQKDLWVEIEEWMNEDGYMDRAVWIDRWRQMDGKDGWLVMGRWMELDILAED